MAVIPSAIRLSNSRATHSDWIQDDNVAVLERPRTGRFHLFRFDVDCHALLDSVVVGDGFISKPSAKAGCKVEAAIFPCRVTLPACLWNSFFPRRSSLKGYFATAPVCDLLPDLLFLLRGQKIGGSEQGETSLLQRLWKVPTSALFLSNWCVEHTTAHQSTSRTEQKCTGC